MENSHVHSFFQNSCQGTSVAESVCNGKKTNSSTGLNAKWPNGPNAEVEGQPRKKSVVGRITCCVPECFNNSLRNPELSYYVIPNEKSKEKQWLRKRWLHMISHQNFENSGVRQRVCSKHFVSGQKTYRNNVPIIVPKNQIKKQPKERTTTKARNKPVLVHGTTTFKNIILTEESTTMKQQKEVYQDYHENAGI